MSQYGIKETKDVLIALNLVSLIIIKQVKDGVQMSDIGAIILGIMNSDETKAALVAAVENILAVPKEIADTELAEGLELGAAQLEFLPKLLEALKA